MTKQHRKKGLKLPEPRGTLEEQNAFYGELENSSLSYRIRDRADVLAREHQTPWCHPWPQERAIWEAKLGLL